MAAAPNAGFLSIASGSLSRRDNAPITGFPDFHVVHLAARPLDGPSPARAGVGKRRSAEEGRQRFPQAHSALVMAFFLGVSVRETPVRTAVAPRATRVAASVLLALTRGGHPAPRPRSVRDDEHFMTPPPGGLASPQAALHRIRSDGRHSELGEPPQPRLAPISSSYVLDERRRL